MQPAHDAMVYVVDDDAGVRDALAWLLRSRGIVSTGLDSAEAMLALIDAPEWRWHPGCLLLDVRMPGMSGLELFGELTRRGCQQCLPVIFLTGHAELQTAVEAVKRGAFDYCAKPISDNALADRVLQAVEFSRQALLERERTAGVQARLAELTERERAVMRLIVEGLPNKKVADMLQISVRTVEVHRSKVFDKMGVRSAVELAKLLSGG